MFDKKDVEGRPYFEFSEFGSSEDSMAYPCSYTSDTSQEFFHRVGLFYACCLLNELPLPHRLHPYLFVKRFGFEYSRNMVKDFNATVWKMCAFVHTTFAPGGMVVTEQIPHFDDYINSYEIKVSN